MKPFLCLHLGLLLLLVDGTPALGLPYSELIVFGDSLSDVGNVSQSTDEAFLIPRIPFDQTDAYFQGRFSNGPVYSEQLSQLLGLGPLVQSRSGGTNYAHGNAMTTGTSFLLSGVIDDIDDQVDDYLGSSPTISSDSLFVVFAGANDLIDGVADVNTPVNNLATDINRLINAGAENLLVANLPLLGLTPRFNGNPTEAATMNALTTDFNNSLSGTLDSIEASSPGVDLFRLDVAQLINDAVSDPAAFGLANATDPAAPGLGFATINYDSSQIVAQPETYLFWDDLHPTTAAHALLAEFAFSTVTFSADFDFDGVVDGADLSQWETSYGADAESDANGDGNSDGLDFLDWQVQLGSGAGGLVATVAAVPEPTALALAALLVCLVARSRSVGRP